MNLPSPLNCASSQSLPPMFSVRWVITRNLRWGHANAETVFSSGVLDNEFSYFGVAHRINWSCLAPIIPRVSQLMAELLVIGITWWYTYQSYRIRGGITFGKTISSLLFYNGELAHKYSC